MSAESRLVVHVWETVAEFLPNNKKEEVAESILRYFADFGFERSDLTKLLEEEDHLKEAFEVVFDSEEDDNDYDSFYEDDDE